MNDLAVYNSQNSGEESEMFQQFKFREGFIDLFAIVTKTESRRIIIITSR